MAIFSQSVIVLFLVLAMWVHQSAALQGIDDFSETNWLYRVLGFSTRDSLATVMVIILYFFLVVFFLLVINQAVFSPDKPVLKLSHTGQPPKLSLDKGKRYHLFLSHGLPSRFELLTTEARALQPFTCLTYLSAHFTVWSSGQDQVAVIKLKLKLQLPGVSIFLEWARSGFRTSVPRCV